MLFAYLDDIRLQGPPTTIAAALRILSEELGKLGLDASHEKTKWIGDKKHYQSLRSGLTRGPAACHSPVPWDPGGTLARARASCYWLLSQQLAHPEPVRL
jgi:hypothetical protein